jgi:hypothetical protein
VISASRPRAPVRMVRAPVRMVTMRKADEDMAGRLEARAELRAGAGPAVRELDHVRAERAELGRA